MNFEMELEAKRMEEERIRRRSEQEHEIRVLQMLVALVRPQQQSLVGSLFIDNQSQSWTPTVQSSLSEAHTNVPYDILSNLTFN